MPCGTRSAGRGSRGMNCGREDRGDGVFVLVPAEVPKGLLAGSLPPALVTALRAHNGASGAGADPAADGAARRGGPLRRARGDCGAVNLAFRLVDAARLRRP